MMELLPVKGELTAAALGEPTTEAGGSMALSLRTSSGSPGICSYDVVGERTIVVGGQIGTGLVAHKARRWCMCRDHAREGRSTIADRQQPQKHLHGRA